MYFSYVIVLKQFIIIKLNVPKYYKILISFYGRKVDESQKGAGVRSKDG